MSEINKKAIKAVSILVGSRIIFSLIWYMILYHWIPPQYFPNSVKAFPNYLDNSGLRLLMVIALFFLLSWLASRALLNDRWFEQQFYWAWIVSGFFISIRMFDLLKYEFLFKAVPLISLYGFCVYMSYKYPEPKFEISNQT